MVSEGLIGEYESCVSESVKSATLIEESQETTLVTSPIKIPDSVSVSQTERLESFYENCLNFYLTLLPDMIKRFDFFDKFFEIAEMLEPTAVRDFQQHRLKSLFDRFPHLHEVCC